MNNFIKLKNIIIRWVYRKILKPQFFRIDPEEMHDSMTRNGKFLGNYGITRGLTGLMFDYKHPMLEQRVLGIKFKNPIGLAAGFDKDAQLTQILPSVGFGYEEIGSITGEPCEGNPKPRLWRAKKSQSIVVYYGLNNKGAEIIHDNLKDLDLKFPLGISIAKTNCKETVDTHRGVDDYFKAYKILQNLGDYFTINISCPNAFGGQPYTDRESLNILLEKLYSIDKKKPFFIKLSPDLTDNQLDDIISLADQYNIDGFICANLTKKRDLNTIKDEDISEMGGLSGKVIQRLSDDLIKKVYNKTKGRFIIIGVGGIFSASDAYRKIKLGATLLQMITGMIYEGPQVIGEINRGLVKLLKKDGFKNISEAIGVENKYE